MKAWLIQKKRCGYWETVNIMHNDRAPQACRGQKVVRAYKPDYLREQGEAVKTRIKDLFEEIRGFRKEFSGEDRG